MRRGFAALVVAAGVGVSCAGTAVAQQGLPPLKGPKGVSSSKVLVIGTDGTRWDRVEALMNAGKLPNLRRIRSQGFGGPTLLEYFPLNALTLSEVGWSTLATGVWPDKHGVKGYRLNKDPKQATKNGYLDFLTRLEVERKALSTFLVADWGNIGEHKSGGPIFGDAIDVKRGYSAVEKIGSWDEADQKVTDTSARYLRKGNPDAGFVYLGVVDEAGHLSGSANPIYDQEIERTDRRIGELIAAIRARRTYKRERWSVIVTTDHGHINSKIPPRDVSHGGATKLERTSFLIGMGPGFPRGPIPTGATIVDIAPTVFRQLTLPVQASWKLDGKSLVGAPAPQRSRR